MLARGHVIIVCILYTDIVVNCSPTQYKEMGINVQPGRESYMQYIV